MPRVNHGMPGLIGNPIAIEVFRKVFSLLQCGPLIPASATPSGGISEGLYYGGGIETGVEEAKGRGEEGEGDRYGESGEMEPQGKSQLRPLEGFCNYDSFLVRIPVELPWQPDNFRYCHGNHVFINKFKRTL